MTTFSSSILWFRAQFAKKIKAKLKQTGLPFDVDFLAALAFQETGFVWSVLQAKGYSTSEILKLCVGDTLDEDKGRRAFPKTKEHLLAHPQGQAMFEIARACGLALSKHVKGYDFVRTNPAKFCRGFGIFQYDLQFFRTNPNHFLNRKFEDFDACLDLCLGELKRGLVTLGYTAKPKLSDLELTRVAIAYNTGGYKPGLGLKQGHKNGNGQFYGELVYELIAKCRSVPDAEPAIAKAGLVPLPQPSPITANGIAYVVDTQLGNLNLRSSPSNNSSSNIITSLPDGHPVKSTGSPAQNEFLEVETSRLGAFYRGFVAFKYLKKSNAAEKIILKSPLNESLPPKGLTAVSMPRRPGVQTLRTEFANAHTISEGAMPTRKGATIALRLAEIDRIVDWLNVESPAHTRYAPRDGMTFCNIYAHDFCFLMGAYIPRVWWTQSALLQIGTGEIVAPKYGATIEEVRANGLFRWLRDFGLKFGWRQTGSLTALQEHANQGGVALVVARRKMENRSGHIVMVLPESGTIEPKRDSTGEVVVPVQSQAGATNVKRGTGNPWWTGDQFAEWAYWIHS